MSDILRRILEIKREEIRAGRAQVPEAEMARRARAAPPGRGFQAALRAAIAAGRPAVIAESKRASPSKGLLRDPFDPAQIARSYEAGGSVFGRKPWGPRTRRHQRTGRAWASPRCLE